MSQKAIHTFKNTVLHFDSTQEVYEVQTPERRTVNDIFRLHLDSKIDVHSLDIGVAAVHSEDQSDH